MKPNPQTYRRIPQGITLVELMVALVISSIILLGVATVYSSSKRSYKIQEEFSRLQENTRFAFLQMTQEIRNAGWVSDTPLTKLNCIAADSDICNNFSTWGITGFEYAGTGPGNNYTITSLTNTGTPTNWSNGAGNNQLPAWLNGNVLAGNDVLIFASTEPAGNDCKFDCAKSLNQGSARFPKTGCGRIGRGTLVLLTDGKNTDIFQNVNVASASTFSRGTSAGLIPGNLNPAGTSWTVAPLCDANGNSNLNILVAKYVAYYVGIGASGEPALYQYDITGNPTELVEAVENMQILYGIDNNPSDADYQPDQFVSAANVSNFEDVIAVRISLLVRTPAETNRPVQAATLRLLGVDNATSVDVTTLPDRRLRKTFTTTIALRNKALNRKEFE